MDDALTSGVITIAEFLDRLKIDKCEELERRITLEIESVNKSSRIVNDKKELKIARIVSCIIKYLIDATIQNSKSEIQKNKNCEKLDMSNQKKMVSLSEEDGKICSYLERVVQKKVICNNEVARADYNANVVVKELFEKYYSNPRLLHEGTVHKIFTETLMHENPLVARSAVNINDASIEVANKEIEQWTTKRIDYKKIKAYREDGIIAGAEKDIIIFEKRRILIRCIVDFIAGMTDGYALEEYEKLK